MKLDIGLPHFLICEVFYIIEPLGKSILSQHINDTVRINTEELGIP